MLGIILVAHNDLAESMKSVAEHVAGPLPDLLCVSVNLTFAFVLNVV